MKVYTHNKLKGFYPVGAAAVVVANDKKDAKMLLELALIDALIPQSVNTEDLVEVPIHIRHATVLLDGNY